MSKLLQEINLQVLRQPPTTSTPIPANSSLYHQPYQQPSYQQQAIPSRQFPNINFFQTQQESKSKTQRLKACLLTISHQIQLCLVTYLRDYEKCKS